MAKFTVKSLWISSVIDELQLICIKSFINMGVDFHLYTYVSIKNLPEGIFVRDANEILDRSNIFRDNKNTYATFSDWFRIKLLHDVGGWWVDCDILLLKKFNFRSHYVIATEKFYDSDLKLQLRICNAVLKMPRGSQLAKNILISIDTLLLNKPNFELAWTEIGAQLLREEIFNLGLEKSLVLPEVFCPIDWNNFRDATQVSNIIMSDNTYGIHLWNNIWSWNNIDPIKDVSIDSILNHAIENLK